MKFFLAITNVVFLWVFLSLCILATTLLIGISYSEIEAAFISGGILFFTTVIGFILSKGTSSSIGEWAICKLLFSFGSKNSYTELLVMAVFLVVGNLFLIAATCVVWLIPKCSVKFFSFRYDSKCTS